MRGVNLVGAKPHGWLWSRQALHMSLTGLVILALALSGDAFSLCLGLGLVEMDRAKMIAFVLIVAALHIIMPVAGYLAGNYLDLIVGHYAVIAGALVLFYLGIKMLREGVHSGGQGTGRMPLGVAGLVLLAVSVSLDSLSAGFTLGTQKVSMLPAAGLFGLVAGTMTLLGLLLGRRLGLRLGKRAQVLGGLILLLIGVKSIWP